MGFNEWLKECDKEIQELEQRNKTILEQKKADRKKEIERYERIQAMKVQVTKCYLVQVLDEDGNELVCDYSFVNTKKEAEDLGYRLREEIVLNDNR